MNCHGAVSKNFGMQMFHQVPRIGSFLRAKIPNIAVVFFLNLWHFSTVKRHFYDLQSLRGTQIRAMKMNGWVQNILYTTVNAWKVKIKINY